MYVLVIPGKRWQLNDIGISVHHLVSLAERAGQGIAKFSQKNCQIKKAVCRIPDSRVRIPTKSNCRLGSVAAKAKQLQLDLFKLLKQPINKAVELAALSTEHRAQHSSAELGLDEGREPVQALVGASAQVSQPETPRLGLLLCAAGSALGGIGFQVK